MTENLAEDLPHADDSILGSSSSNSSDEDDHRQTSYADSRKSEYIFTIAFCLEKDRKRRRRSSDELDSEQNR